jgi:hypothetical protein
MKRSATRRSRLLLAPASRAGHRFGDRKLRCRHCGPCSLVSRVDPHRRHHLFRFARFRSIVGMAEDVATGGYWLVASDGGSFSFNAPFLGSAGNLALARPIVGIESPGARSA